MVVFFMKGLSIGSTLIVAIGAQNAFVLNQGVRRNHFIIVPLICTLSDIMLITIGVTGLGTLISSNDILRKTAAICGILYLFWFGLKSFISVWKSESLKSDERTVTRLRDTILATLGVTYLNPHVYLDTVLFIGTIAGQFSSVERLYFGMGASLASTLWFFSLSLGGRLLAPVFARPASWKLLDCSIGIVMWSIAFSLFSHI